MINRRTGRHEVKATGKGTFKSRGTKEKEEERFFFHTCIIVSIIFYL